MCYISTLNNRNWKHADTCHFPTQVINARQVALLLPEAINSAYTERNKL